MSKNGNLEPSQANQSSSSNSDENISISTEAGLLKARQELEDKILKFEKEKQAFEAAKKAKEKTSVEKLRKAGQRGAGLSVFEDEEDEEEAGSADLSVKASSSSTSVTKNQPLSLAEAVALKNETKGSWFKNYNCLTSNETNDLAKLGRKLIRLPETLCEIASQGGKTFKCYNDEIRSYWYTIRAIQTGLTGKPNRKGYEEASLVISETLEFLDQWLNTHCSPQQNLPGALTTMAQVFQDPVVKFLLGEREATLLVGQIRSVGKKFSRLSCQSSYALHNWNPNHKSHDHKNDSKSGRQGQNKRKAQDNAAEEKPGFKKMSHKDKYWRFGLFG